MCKAVAQRALELSWTSSGLPLQYVQDIAVVHRTSALCAEAQHERLQHGDREDDLLELPLVQIPLGAENFSAGYHLGGKL